MIALRRAIAPLSARLLLLRHELISDDRRGGGSRRRTADAGGRAVGVLEASAIDLVVRGGRPSARRTIEAADGEAIGRASRRWRCTRQGRARNFDPNGGAVAPDLHRPGNLLLNRTLSRH